MKELLEINNKTIYDTDTTILYTSEYNYTKDAIAFINNDCVVIDKFAHFNLADIRPDILNLFNCNYLLHKKVLTKLDELKIIILGNLVTTKKVFVFLNVLTFLDADFREKVILYLKRTNKRIINYTSDSEETLLFPYLIVIHNNEVIVEGKTSLVLKEERILKKLGFKLPFIIELSSGLKYYGIIDKIYLNNESLVDDIWK